MVGTGHVLAFCLLVGLPCWGYLLAVKNGASGLLGFGAGVAAFVAVMSGNLLRLMVLDFRERKKYPHRAGVGWRAGAIVVVAFAVSVAVCVAFFVRVASG